MPWSWQPESQKAFESVKELLQSAKLLANYDVNLPIRRACDALSYGVGVLLSHLMPYMESLRKSSRHVLLLKTCCVKRRVFRFFKYYEIRTITRNSSKELFKIFACDSRQQHIANQTAS